MDAIPYLISILNKDFSYGKTMLGRVDLALNKLIYFDMIKSIAFNVLFITIGLHLYRSKKWPRHALIVYFIVYLLIAFVFLYPILVFFNILLIAISNNPPIYNMKDKQRLFPIASMIEANHEVIKDEFLQYKNVADCTFKQTVGFRIGTSEDEGKCWRMIVLKHAGMVSDLANHFPRTKQLIQNDLIHNAVFSILDGNVNIEPHIGYYKGYLRYHLGVVVPEENGQRPYIVVGDQKYYWKEGEGVLFDDMFYHYVKNPTSKRRAVLYIDVIRPLPEPLATINKFLIKIIENNVIIKYILQRQHKQVSNT